MRVRKVDSDAIKLYESSQVKFKTTGTIREIQFSAGVNKSCAIQNISKDTYLDKATGEIKERKHNTNRFQSPKSLRKSINRLTDLIRCNATHPAYCKWITLTYADTMTDGKRVYDDGKMFLRKLQRFLNKQADLSSGQKNFKRITIAEPHRQEKHRGAMYRKSDSDDAEAIALATLNMLDKLPDACPNDAYWSLGQLVHRRDNIVKQRTRLVNQLHEQLCIAYPSYKSFFNDISRPTALYFWEHYPSRKYLRGKSVEDLRKELVPVSHNKCSTKTCEKILDAVASDKVKNIDYQDGRDMVTLSIVSDLQHYDSQLAEVDKMLEQMYKMLGCTLTTIPGVNVITAVKILAEIGDIKRFSNANKLAQFAGIAPLHLSSSGKGKDVATKQGNRRLQATIYFLAIQMVQVSSKGTPRNPVVRAYYEKRKAEGKTSQQALICISRRLISIIYGMLKNGTEYRMPVVENAGENR